MRLELHCSVLAEEGIKRAVKIGKKRLSIENIINKKDGKANGYGY